MNVLDKDEIIVAIKKAMKSTLDDIEMFVDIYTQGIQAEYLFTVNLAKTLAKYNQLPGDPYKIRLERKARVFARECLPAFKTRNNVKIRNKFVFLKDVVKTYRDGKIDLVLYNNNIGRSSHVGDYPVCAIELKAFNPPKNKIKDDLLRNLAFLDLRADTGESVLEFTAFAAFHWDQQTPVGDDNSHKEKLLKKYSNIVDELPTYKSIEIHTPLVFTVSSNSGTPVFDIDGGEQDNSNKHHFTGVIIIFSKNTSQNESSD